MPLSTLTRYVVRSLLGPFLFACGAVNGLLFLTVISNRFADLAGKGVGASVILEMMLLALPSVVTFAVPMALFTATLYVMANLGQSRELVALAAGGIHPWRLLLPIAGVGLAASLLMLRFNDRVLADANARFTDRLDAITRTRPAVQIREGVVHALRPPDGSARFVWVRTLDRDTLRDITVIDLSRSDRPVFVTAPVATSALAPNGRDLLLRLRDGQLISAALDSGSNLHTMQFQTQVTVFRDVVSAFGMEVSTRTRAERELRIAVLRARLTALRSELASADVFDVMRLRVEGNRYRSELHRRYATASACLVFVLLAAPLGMRFGGSGIGMVINASVAVLVVFRVGTIIGDRLVDAGRLHPVTGSWVTVGALLAAALWLLRSTSRYAVRSAEGQGLL